MTDNKTKKSLPKGANRKNTFLWIGLIFFVSAWMFVLGILVGRGTAPVHFDMEKLQKELAALKTAVLEKELKRYKINTPNPHEKPELGFHKALKSPEADVRLSAKKPAKKNSSSGTARKSGSADKESALLLKALIESGRLFTIQVASSKNIKIANQIVARLKKKGYSAYRETARIPGKGTWYRVRIGGFRERTEAVQLLDTLRKNNIKGFVVKR